MIFRHRWDGTAFRADWGDADVPRLASLVIRRLFTDARADAGEVPAGEDRRGAWADALRPDRDPMGSKLWLLPRRKATEETRVWAERETRRALAQLISDGVASAVEVTASWIAPEQLGLQILLTGPDGPARYAFDLAWSDAYAVG